jgi:hypothetical protein
LHHGQQKRFCSGFCERKLSLGQIPPPCTKVLPLSSCCLTRCAPFCGPGLAHRPGVSRRRFGFIDPVGFKHGTASAFYNQISSEGRILSFSYHSNGLIFEFSGRDRRETTLRPNTPLPTGVHANKPEAKPSLAEADKLCIGPGQASWSQAIFGRQGGLKPDPPV